MEIEILENLKKAVRDYDPQGAATWAKKAVEEKIDAIKALDTLTEAIREIGHGFGKGDLFLPDLVGGADAMQAAMPILEAEIEDSAAKRETLGTVVIGTVFGDIHSIGITMVSSLLAAEGFKVHNLGVDVRSEKFVEAVKEHDANILAMSALMTMTAPEQQKVIETLKKEGMRQKLKIMVGGGAITAQFAEGIGADGYDPTAPGAVRLARSFIGA